MTNTEPPAPEELEVLIRLLDDESPEVRSHVAGRLAAGSGDISEWFATWPGSLGNSERRLLVELLRPARRETLAREWIAPTGGAAALGEDWESFEALLRTLSDFLHDGLSLRQPLSDALDLVAEEAADDGVASADELRIHLFERGRLTGNFQDPGDPRNLDLAWCLVEGRSCPLGLCLIFMLTARRFNLEVEGVDLPLRFMCRIFEDGLPYLVDCLNHGKIHLQSELVASGELTQAQRAMLIRSVDPGTILVRFVRDLESALEMAGRTEDARLIRQLRATLE